MKWLKQLFCRHLWKDDGSMDFCHSFSIFQIQPRTERLLRRHWYSCIKCHKHKTVEEIITRDNW